MPMTFAEFWKNEREKAEKQYASLGLYGIEIANRRTWSVARKGMVPVEEVAKAKDESASGEECDAMLQELIQRYGG